MDKNEAFREWLREEIKSRGWKQADLVRESGLDSAVISNIINGKRKVGETTIIAIARALRLPPDLVFQKAGILPAKADDLTPLQRSIIGMVQELPDSDLEMVDSILRTHVSKKTKQTSSTSAK